MLGWDAHLYNTKDLAFGNNSFPISHCEFSEAVPTYTYCSLCRQALHMPQGDDAGTIGIVRAPREELLVVHASLKPANPKPQRERHPTTGYYRSQTREG